MDDKQDVKKFIMFDFECSQDEVSTCTEGYLPSSCSQCVQPMGQCTHHLPVPTVTNLGAGARNINLTLS